MKNNDNDKWVESRWNITQFSTKCIADSKTIPSWVKTSLDAEKAIEDKVQAETQVSAIGP
jgi:hypothetical protein